MLKYTFVDLGLSPLANSFIDEKKEKLSEKFYPLHAYVCDKCYLVQLEEFETPENIFSDYIYFSSYSDSWLTHSKEYTENIIRRFRFDETSLVVEVASNDGYLLQYFKKNNIPVLGIEPAQNVAEAARKKGINTYVMFFGVNTAEELASKGLQADLLIGNNVLAHVPDINDFVRGLKIALKPDGVITLEFPHLLQLIINSQFDTIYHEHFSYFSLISITKILEKHDMTIFDLDELQTHGGSLRIYASHTENKTFKKHRCVDMLFDKEVAAGLKDMKTYTNFNKKIYSMKSDLLRFLIKAKTEGKKVAGYGAPAKGNTLLNFCGIGKDYLPYTVDRNPNKQNTLLPGSRIPVYAPNKIFETKPDYVIILPWNLKSEIIKQLSEIREWGASFIVPIPRLEIIK
jgi:2-polyprenyl-3-methyl-5-hydroxy-6-metoxy-1,4-benzoquinol methylase